jgi:hypothetical protein
MKPTAVLLTALLASLSIGAVAQTDDTGDTATGNSDESGIQTKTFTELDENRDGTLGQNEFEGANLTQDFSDVDTNGDDTIDRNEFYQAQREQ